jgi:hypothetical protein
MALGDTSGQPTGGLRLREGREASPSFSPASGDEKALRFPVWGIVVGGLAGLLVILALLYTSFFSQPEPPTVQAERPTRTPTPQLTASAPQGLLGTQSAQPISEAPTQPAVENTPTPAPVAFLATPTAPATPIAGDQVYAVPAAAGEVGWVASGDERRNNFDDSYLYAGTFGGQVYMGAFQFDLSSIPRGALIHSAAIQLTGLRADRLGDSGTWMLRLLAPEIDQDWRQHDYQEILNAAVLQTLAPILGEQDLAEGQMNVFELSPEQIDILETRIVDQENPRVSFRIEGPLTGADDLFAWDTGYGPQTRGDNVTLLLSVGAPPATPPAYQYIVVTSTPTPENVLTAAAIVAQITADATRIGTATPIPANMATATPWPEYLIIVPTPTPGNEATAQAIAALVTAQVETTGTPTPISPDSVTATPLPTITPTPTYVLITSTPTADSIFAAATVSAAATAQARSVGIPTPLPANWATPFAVTSTPTPANQATADFLVALATAQAFTTGTPTPTPANMVTATSTPVFVLFDGDLPPMTPTPTPTVVPDSMPAELIGKIAFKSDRTGEERIYVIDPDGSGLALLSDRWPYDLAIQADGYSFDGRFRGFVKEAIINTGIDNGQGGVTPVQLRVPSLFSYDALFRLEEQVSHFGAGIAYDPAWSPVSEQLALVSDDSGNDEIWVINRDGTGALQLTRNQWEWDKHPSWSPDGQQIVFWSNRTGTQQLWLMDRDGDRVTRLTSNPFNDWDPVWIKYPGIPEFRPQP